LDSVRKTIGPDKVLLLETPSGPAGRHCHGGLSADFNYAIHQGGGLSNQKKLVGSPVRYGMPWIRYFSNGRDLNELHQVYAAGHGLALSGTQLTDPESRAHVAKLVGVRREFADTLIRGQQVYQPATDNPEIIAYYFAGKKDRIITVVNTSAANFTGQLQLRQERFDSTWVDLAWLDKTPGGLAVQPLFRTIKGRLIPITVPASSMRVLRRTRKGPHIYSLDAVRKLS
jgi:hypothetical protein